MARLFNFDYKTPFYYMVTLKGLAGLADFSKIGNDGRLVKNAITRAFETAIETFHEKWRCIEPISPYVVMPDHIHLMVKIKDVLPRKSLAVLVWQLTRALSKEYWRVTSGHSRLTQDPETCQSLRVLRGAAAPAPKPAPIFSPSWHDWIVKRDGQLAAFRRYIRENAERAALRRRNARFFGEVRRVSFLGREWLAYGNLEILKLPVLQPLKGHRATAQDSAEWNALIAAASRIGPGGAGVSTFMSPLEKACGNAIAKSGGKWIVLSPEGFGPRWHPPREKERFCAQGRMLFLSLYEADTKKPTKKMLYERCHEMIDLVCEKLG